MLQASIIEGGSFGHERILAHEGEVLHGSAGWDGYAVYKSIKSVKDKDCSCIAQLLPNDASYVIAQAAIWKTGNIAVPLHPHHPESQLKYFINDSKSRFIITNEELASKFSSLLSGYKVLLENSFLKKDDEIGGRNEVEISDDSVSETEILKLNESPALIIYTSGTTGPPKGVVLSHGNIHSQIDCIHKAWEIGPSDVILHCLPLHHVHGVVNALLSPLSCGGRVIMEPHFKASSIWSKFLNLETEISSRVNLFMAVPTIYVKLIEEYENNLASILHQREFVKKVCSDNIRLMISGSAPLPLPVLEKWREITGHTLLERYGMTEIGMALTNPLKGERKPGYVGKPMPGVKVKIVRFSPKRDSYETLCEGNSEKTVVTPGCDKEEEATKKEFTSDGWFCTGDTVAYINGYYKVLGRTSADIIKSGGFKISALDVEREILSHPDIRDVAVIGLPDVTWGEKVVALIVLKTESDLDEKMLKLWLKERIPHYQVPSVVKFLSEGLPRNAMGKVNKKELVAKMSQGK
ncbi:Acyl-CoA synthetase family member 3, mitochondrial [Armadillidium vulgare]|nr:Acyl-CoA synthetase family member 3, mitochondrial [Armadillidium vulgare]